MADNIIDPGSPKYHDFFNQTKLYESVLYFSEDYSSEQEDGFMVSTKI